MAKLHSLLALQQFMQGLGEDMDEAELVRSISIETNDRTEPTYGRINCKINYDVYGSRQRAKIS